MKKVKYFMLAVLGLGLMLATACEKGGDDNGNGGGNQEEEFDPIGGDKRDRVAGVYPVVVDTPVALLTGIPADITIAPVGRGAELSASGSINVSGVVVGLTSTLTELKEFNNVDGRAATGYYFKIAEQSYSIAGQLQLLKGTGAYEDGYDGMVYKMKDGSRAFFSMELSNVYLDGGLTINVETASEE
jgi:hypothetical protein